MPSIKRRKLASLLTYLSTSQIQKAFDGRDRTSAFRRRNYAILMMLATLCLRTDEG
jgi:hypothetical protein